MGHLLSDCAWSQGSRGPQTGCPGGPWILASRRGLAGPGTLVDQGDRRVPSLLSGQGRHQNQEHQAVRVSPRIPSRLAVLWGLEALGAPLYLQDPRGQEALAPL